MNNKAIAGSIVAVVCLLIFSAGTQEAFAQRRGSEGRTRSRAPVVVNLPSEHARVIVGGREYFYARGMFYRSGPHGYILTRGPIGARVRVLPPGYITLQIGGGTFFSFYGTYYRFDPRLREYVVVEPPPGVTPPQDLDRLNLANGSVVEGTYLGGTQSTVQMNVDGKVQEFAVDQIVSIEFAPPQQQ